MRHRTRFAPIVAALLFAALATMSQSAAAKSCSTNTDCTGGQTCQTTLDLWIYKFRECKNTLCNSDVDCRNGTLCLLGMCQAGCRNDNDCGAGQSCTNAVCRNRSGPAPSPGAGTVPGEGRKCMPADGSKPPDWAKDANGKPLGACPAGTSCSSVGFCRKLET